MAEINYPLLKEMIDCVSREISFRYAVYSNRIKVGKMTQEQAKKEIHLMQLIRNSLKKIYDNQASETVQQAFFNLEDYKNKQNEYWR